MLKTLALAMASIIFKESSLIPTLLALISPTISSKTLFVLRWHKLVILNNWLSLCYLWKTTTKICASLLMNRNASNWATPRLKSFKLCAHHCFQAYLNVCKRTKKTLFLRKCSNVQTASSKILLLKQEPETWEELLLCTLTMYQTSKLSMAFSICWWPRLVPSSWKITNCRKTSKILVGSMAASLSCCMESV